MAAASLWGSIKNPSPHLIRKPYLVPPSSRYPASSWVWTRLGFQVSTSKHPVSNHDHLFKALPAPPTLFPLKPWQHPYSAPCSPALTPSLIGPSHHFSTTLALPTHGHRPCGCTGVLLPKRPHSLRPPRQGWASRCGFEFADLPRSPAYIHPTRTTVSSHLGEQEREREAQGPAIFGVQ